MHGGVQRRVGRPAAGPECKRRGPGPALGQLPGQRHATGPSRPVAIAQLVVVQLAEAVAVSKVARCAGTHFAVTCDGEPGRAPADVATVRSEEGILRGAGAIEP